MSEGIVKKGNRYFVIIEGNPDPVTGKRSRKWHSGYDDEESAKKARRRLLVDRDEGAYVDPDRQTVSQYFSEWLIAIRPTVRESTWHSYERNLRLHVSAHVGRVQLRRLDAVGLNALYAHLLVQGHKGHHGDGPA